MTDEMTDRKAMICPSCRSRKTVKNGRHRPTHAQKVLCRNCGKSFRQTYIYKAYQTAPKAERRLQLPAWVSLCSNAKSLDSLPLGLSEANGFILRHHRHHPPVQGYRFAIGLRDENRLVGVVIVGRPVSRHLDDGYTVEVRRCCTDGTKNAASMLYGAARRAAFSLGYKRIITYTLSSESGVSLKAAGWRCMGLAGGGSWNVPSRPRADKHPTELKRRWEVLAG